MANLTDIGLQLTPGTPTEITFAPQTSPPAVVNGVALIGHMNSSGSAASGTQSATGAYLPVEIVNVADPVAGQAEAEGYFGVGSELAAMIVSAINANYEGLGNDFPPLFAVPLQSGDSAWGASNQALQAVDKLPGIEYVVGPYDANDQTTAPALLLETQAMSAPQRVQSGQYGSIAIEANQSVTDPANLFKYDTPFGSFQWFRNTAPTQTNGEIAAAVAAELAANPVPFNPVNNLVLPNIVPSTVSSDPISVGGGLESEVCLQRGWSPLKTLPNNTIAQVRARTLRITLADGVTPVTSYFDVMDFNVLFYWRQTLVTRFAQPDFSQAKASTGPGGTGPRILSEAIRLGQLFQTNGMFQGMDQAAKAFKVQPNVSDRSRFDVLTPVDVVPILAVIATNIQATAAFDAVTV